MAQHIELEHFKDEKWYPRLMRNIESLISKKSEYYSVWDNQCSQYFHSGRNSKTRLDAITECAEMLIEGSGSDESEMDDLYKTLQNSPDEIMDMFDSKVVKHSYKIIDDDNEDSVLKKLPDNYAWNGGEAYSYSSNIKNNISKDEPNLRVSDCGIEIHLNRNIEPKKQIYLVA